MFDLFNPYPLEASSTKSLNDASDYSEIIGLTYIPNFLSEETERKLISSINSEIWLSDIKRRVQHYGYKYDYKSRRIDYSMFLGNLPLWAEPIAYKLFSKDLITEIPDQMIVNEYLPGQGIANHVDCEPCFKETIVSISLGSSCVMDFIRLNDKLKKSLLLERRSVVVLTGEARHLWSHGIIGRKVDDYKGLQIPRSNRISMTFRKVIL
jgi:alkylated DNA repair dioxygenase AlkB